MDYFKMPLTLFYVRTIQVEAICVHLYHSKLIPINNNGTNALVQEIKLPPG